MLNALQTRTELGSLAGTAPKSVIPAERHTQYNRTPPNKVARHYRKKLLVGKRDIRMLGDFNQKPTVEINPELPCEGLPGSALKIWTLEARYAAGIPLWNDADECDND